jgi:hypothetical protein
MTDENKPVKSPLEGLARERYRGRTMINESVVSVNTTQTVLLNENHNRVSWVAINESAVDVRLSNQAPVSATTGWLLQAGGGVIGEEWDTDGEVTGYRVFAVGVGSTATVRVREVIIL